MVKSCCAVPTFSAHDTGPLFVTLRESCGRSPALETVLSVIASTRTLRAIHGAPATEWAEAVDGTAEGPAEREALFCCGTGISLLCAVATPFRPALGFAPPEPHRRATSNTIAAITSSSPSSTTSRRRRYTAGESRPRDLAGVDIHTTLRTHDDIPRVARGQHDPQQQPHKRQVRACSSGFFVRYSRQAHKRAGLQ